MFRITGLSSWFCMALALSFVSSFAPGSPRRFPPQLRFVDLVVRSWGFLVACSAGVLGAGAGGGSSRGGPVSACRLGVVFSVKILYFRPGVRGLGILLSQVIAH